MVTGVSPWAQQSVALLSLWLRDAKTRAQAAPRATVRLLRLCCRWCRGGERRSCTVRTETGGERAAQTQGPVTRMQRTFHTHMSCVYMYMCVCVCIYIYTYIYSFNFLFPSVLEWVRYDHAHMWTTSKTIFPVLFCVGFICLCILYCI